MLHKLSEMVRPPDMTPQQRTNRLLFWLLIVAVGVFVWFAADWIPQKSG